MSMHVQRSGLVPSRVTSALLRDAQQRLGTLKNELNHLAQILNVRIVQSENSSFLEIDPIAGPCRHLNAQTKTLSDHVAVLEDGIDGASIALSNLELQSQVLVKDTDANTSVNLFIFVNAIRAEASRLAQRLGEMHDRFDQTLRQSNPDHPEPTLRRRRDTALSDRYFAELTRWTYRDLARFVSSSDNKEERYLDSNYPYNAIPRVFQSRDYKPSSHHVSFVGHELHSNWVKWRTTVNTEDDIGRKVNAPGNAIPEKFTHVRLPYWLPDSFVLAPIIAHEVAHEVLDDVYGSTLEGEARFRSTDNLTTLFRDCMKSVTDFSDETIGSAKFEEEIISMTTEIVADFLAFARFRTAFTYSAFLLTFESDFYLSVFSDRFGQSRLIPFIKLCLEKGKALEFPSTFDAARELSSRNDLRIEAFKLARLGVMARLVEQQESSNSLDLGFAKAILDTNGVMLKRVFVKDVFDTKGAISRLEANLALIGKKKLSPVVKKYWAQEQGEDVKSQKLKDFFLNPQQLKGEEAKSQKLQDYFLNRQRLSRPLLALWQTGFEAESLIEPTENMTLFADCSHASDIAWRYHWCEQLAANKTQTTQFTVLCSAMMSDYVFRTTTPVHLFNQLYSKAKPLVMADLMEIKKSPLHFFYPDSDGEALANSISREVHQQAHFLPGDDLRRYLLSRGFRSDEYRERFKFFPQVRRDVVLGKEWRTAQDRDGAGSIRPKHEQWILRLYSFSTKEKQAVFLRIANLCTDRDLKSEGSHSVLLGRYDALAICPANEHNRRIEEVTNPNGTQAAFVEHSRTVIPLFGRVVLKPIAFIFVSLCSPLAIPILHNWCQSEFQEQIETGNLRVFHSEGWEDLIFMFNDSEALSSSELLNQVFAYLGRISAHPVVRKTETNFTHLLFRKGRAQDKEILWDPRHSIRLRCRAATGMPLRASELLKDWTNLSEKASPVIRVLTGLTDFEIRIKVKRNDLTVKEYLEVVEVLRGILNASVHISRLQTQIAFSDAEV